MQNEPYVEKIKRLSEQAQEHNRNMQTAAVELEGCFNRISEAYKKLKEITERMVEQ